MTDLPQNLHRDIMRSVKVVKTRYYLYGFFVGFLLCLSAMSYLLYLKFIEYGSFDFLSIWIESIKINFAELFDFNDEISEFFPWTHLGVWLIIFLIFGLLSLIIFRFRKALFTKVDKFINEKNKN